MHDAVMNDIEVLGVAMKIRRAIYTAESSRQFSSRGVELEDMGSTWITAYNSPDSVNIARIFTARTPCPVSRRYILQTSRDERRKYPELRKRQTYCAVYPIIPVATRFAATLAVDEAIRSALTIGPDSCSGSPLY